MIYLTKQTQSLDRISLQPAASDHVTISCWVNDRTQKSDQFMVFGFKREIKKERKKEKEHLFAFISCIDEVASNTCNYSLLEKGIN